MMGASRSGRTKKNETQLNIGSRLLMEPVKVRSLTATSKRKEWDGMMRSCWWEYILIGAWGGRCRWSRVGMTYCRRSLG